MDSAALSQVAASQARVQAEISTHMLKVAMDTGPKQTLQLVEQAVEMASEIASASAGPGRLDVYA